MASILDIKICKKENEEDDPELVKIFNDVNNAKIKMIRSKFRILKKKKI